MSHHEKTDKQVVISQLICFLFASVIGFMADLFIKEGGKRRLGYGGSRVYIVIYCVGCIFSG